MKVRHRITGQDLTIRNVVGSLAWCYVEPRESMYYTRLHDYLDKVVLCSVDNLEQVQLGQQMKMFFSEECPRIASTLFYGGEMKYEVEYSAKKVIWHNEGYMRARPELLSLL